MALRFVPGFWSPSGIDDDDAPFGVAVAPTPVSGPRLVAWNEALAERLGLSAAERASDAVVAAFAGNDVTGALPGARPRALVYAGHQFGNFVPRLGDGRAILLGEVDSVDGEHCDLQLKGAGPTPYSRGGDGRAAIGPALREFILAEAMHTLGVKTSQALVVVATGEPVYRETPLPGAVVTRVARSHLRVGTFEYFGARGDVAALRRLVDHAIARHHHCATDSEDRVLGLVDAVVDSQAELVASWMAVGFVHGVMNTDNCSIAGETLDYGPAAFLDAYDPSRTFSSIDRQGRYAYGRQAQMAMWNIMRLGDALLPLLLAKGDDDALDNISDDDVAAARAVVGSVVARFPAAFASASRRRFSMKLGLSDGAKVDDADVNDADAVIDDVLAHMADAGADFTATFRALADVIDGVPAEVALALALSASPTAAATRLVARIAAHRRHIVERVGAGAALAALSTSMRATNPAAIPRNHLVEVALSAASAGDLAPTIRLRARLQRPFDAQSADGDEIPGAEQARYKTFCGT